MSTTEDETRSVLMCRSRTLYLGSRSDRARVLTHISAGPRIVHAAHPTTGARGRPAPGPRQARRRLLPRLDDSDSAARIKSRVVTRVVSARRIARSALAGSCSCSAPDRATDPAACGPCRFVVPRDGMPDGERGEHRTCPEFPPYRTAPRRGDHKNTPMHHPCGTLIGRTETSLTCDMPLAYNVHLMRHRAALSHCRSPARVPGARMRLMHPLPLPLRMASVPDMWVPSEVDRRRAAHSAQLEVRTATFPPDMIACGATSPPRMVL